MKYWEDIKNVSVVIKRPLILNKVAYVFSEIFPIFFPNTSTRWIKIERIIKSNKMAVKSPKE
jgi:hypothetical protein